MFEFLLLLTTVVIVGGMWLSYRRIRDPFVPAVIFGPMLLYMYVYSPLALFWGGALERFFEPANLQYVQMVNLAFVTALCIGLVPRVSAAMAASGSVGLTSSERLVDPRTQRILFRIACVLGFVSLGVFIWLLMRSGGPFHVFDGSKVYIRHPVGYISEIQMFSYPAIVLLAVALQGRRLKIDHIMLALLFALPHLSVGLLGQRRGPAFLILATLLVSWYIARQQRPSLRTAISGVMILGLVMLLLFANRGAHRGGGDGTLDAERVVQTLTFENNAESGQEYIYAGGLIITTDHTGEYYLGRRWFMQFVLRPFPTFLWPTIYEDMGFSDMLTDPGHAGFSEQDWQEGAGFVPSRGTAGGVAADLFREWGWIGVMFAFLIGKFYAWAWRGFAREGGIWTVTYVMALALSVYLVSQSVGAWAYRLLLLVIPVWLAWRYLVHPRVQAWRRRRQAAPADAPGPRPQWQQPWIAGAAPVGRYDWKLGREPIGAAADQPAAQGDAPRERR